MALVAEGLASNALAANGDGEQPRDVERQVA